LPGLKPIECKPIECKVIGRKAPHPRGHPRGIATMTAHAIDPLPKVWDPDTRVGDMLKGHNGLVVGIANADSIAYGCAVKLRAFGANLAVTYLNERSEKYVRPLAEQLDADIILPLDVEQPGQLQSVMDHVRARWGRLDFLIHSIAFAPKDDLHGRVIDCSREGFEQAMRVSCYSFIEMARLAEPLMTRGGVLLAMSYYGADKVVSHYNVMGPVKAALEASARYLAAELGEKNIRVYTVSPGPLKTRASSGIAQFDELIDAAVTRSPGRRLVDIAEVGRVIAFLVGGAASGITGDTIYVDAGLHNIA
jgi:enoyl-[acyl-carrier protein] reductase I